MELKEELTGIRQQGLELAATIWETLEALPVPILPVNIFKASCSAKCAEFMTRLHNNPLFAVVVKSIARFLDGTLKIASEFGGSNKDEGMRVIEIFDEAMPLTMEVFDDARAYATRQHV